MGIPGASLVAQMVKPLPAMWKTWVQFLGWEDSLEKEIATHSSKKKKKKEMGNQTTLLASWEICMQVKKQQLEPDMEQKTGSKLGKEYVKAVYCHPAYWIYRQSTWREMSGWMNPKLESRLMGEKSTTSDMQMTPPLW